MCPRSPSQRVEELGFNPAALDPVPTAPSTGPGWLGSLPAGLCPQTSSLNPRLPTGTGSPDHEHEGLHGSQRSVCPSWHHRPYTLWSQAGGTGWEGESGSSKEEAPRLAELQVEKAKGWGATLAPVGGVGAKKKRAEWANAGKP